MPGSSAGSRSVLVCLRVWVWMMHLWLAWRGPIWILWSQRCIVMSDWMMRLWIGPEWSSLFVLILFLLLSHLMSLSLPLSLTHSFHTHTHLNPSGLWQDYQTQASVQLAPPPSLTPLPCHQTPQRRLQIVFPCHQLFFTPESVSHILEQLDTWFLNNGCRDNIFGERVGLFGKP